MALAEKEKSQSPARRKSIDATTDTSVGDAKSKEAKGGLSHYFVSTDGVEIKKGADVSKACLPLC